MRTLIVVVLSASVALTSVTLVGCKKQTSADMATEPSGTRGDSDKTMAAAGMSAMRPGLAPDKRTAPRPAVSGKALPVQGSQPVAGLERAAFVPADAVAYGSVDSRRLLAAAKPVMMLFFGLSADSARAKSGSKPLVKTSSKVIVKTSHRRPKLTYTMLVAMARRKYGIDVPKLGRLTVIGVVPAPSPKNRSAFYAEPVFLAAAAAFTPPQAQPVETVDGVKFYAVTGRPTRSRIAVVGDTVVFGETATVKRVVAARLGKAPRIGDRAPLVRSIRSLRATQPKATSFMVLDFAALRKKITPQLGAWEKELESGAIFFSDTSLVVLVKGQAKRIALASELLKDFVVQARKALPLAKRQLTKAAGPAAGKFVDEVRLALKNVVVKAQGDTLTIRLGASPVKVMTAVGMLGYFMLVRGSDSSAAGPRD